MLSHANTWNSKMASQQTRRTPVKCMDSCVCCGKLKSTDMGQFYLIVSPKATEKGLIIIIQRYGGLKVVDGVVCRSCHDRVMNIHTAAEKFHKMCQKSALGSKRCASSPSGAPPPSPSVSLEANITPHYVPLPLKKKVKKRLVMSPGNISSNVDEELACSLDATPDKLGISKDSTQPDCLSDTDPILSATLTRDTALQGSISFSERQTFIQQLNTFSVRRVAEAIMQTPCIYKAVEKLILQKINRSVSSLNHKNPKYGYVSKLMTKGFKALEEFSWEEIVQEISTKIPELFNIMVTVCVGHTGVTKEKLNKLLPRLGMSYAIMIQSRHHELSRMQRILTMILQDNVCEQKLSICL